MARGTKVSTMKTSCSKPEDTPFGMLLTAIQKTPWGGVATTDSYTYSASLMHHQQDEMILEWDYNGTDIEISVKWDTYRYPRFAFRVLQPSCVDELTSRTSNGHVTGYSAYISTAAEKIGAMFTAAAKVRDEEIIRSAQNKKRYEGRVAYKKNAVKALDYSIVEEYGDFKYGEVDKTKDFGIRFLPVDIDDHIEGKADGPQLFSIARLSGLYSLEEIEEIIKLISRSPRAVAARMLR